MGLADHFAAMKTANAGAPARPAAAKPAGIPKVQTARRPDVQTAKRPNGRAGVGKKQHPDFTQVTVYIRKDTHRLARRKVEDADDGDFSDLVERLVAEYLER